MSEAASEPGLKRQMIRKTTQPLAIWFTRAENFTQFQNKTVKINCRLKSYFLLFLCKLFLDNEQKTKENKI